MQPSKNLAPPASEGTPARGRLLRVLATLFSVAVFALLAGLLYQHSSKEMWMTVLRSPVPFLLATLLWLTNSIGGFVVWYLFAARTDKSLRLTQSYYPYGYSLLSKYLPLGKLAQFVSFLPFSFPMEKKLNFMFALFAVNLVGLIAGVCLALIAGAKSLGLPGIGSLALFAGAAGVGVYALYSTNLIKRVAEKIKPELALAVQPLNLKLVCLAFAILFAGCWASEIVALALLLQSAGVVMTAGELPFLIVSYVGACLAGYATILTPVGMGAREISLVLLLQARYSNFASVYASVAMRCACLLAELAFVAPLVVSRLRGLNDGNGRR